MDIELGNQQAEENMPAIKVSLRSFSGLVEESVKEWWQNIRKLMGVYYGVYSRIALYHIPLIIIFVIAFILLVGSIDKFLGGGMMTLWAIFISAMPIAIAFSLLSFLILLYFHSKGEIAVFNLIKNNYQGIGKDAYRQAKSLAPTLFVLKLLITALIFLWSLLLIIPGIIFYVYYSLASYVLYFEGLKGKAALRRSQELVKGYWWKVVWYSLGIILMASFIPLVLQVISDIVTNIAPSDISAMITRFINLGRSIYIISTTSLLLIFLHKLYQDLVRIKGGSN